MKKTLFYFVFLSFALSLSSLKAQEAKGPVFTGQADKMYVMPSLSSLTQPEIAKDKSSAMKDSRYYKHNLVIGKDVQNYDDKLASNPHKLTQKIPGRTPSLVFDAASSNSQPTDPALAVGPDHVFVVFNTGFIIFDKQGNALTNQLAPSNIFGTNGCCDLTASYDHVADRWVLSLLGNGALVAVSDGPNPLTSDWFVYQYNAVNDYQKLSVWSDGYYMTDNTGGTNKIYAFERSKMLVGDVTAKILAFPLPGLVTSGFFSPQFFTLSDTNAPAPGNVPVVYLQDDAWSGVTQDHIKLWNLTVDWNTPANSVISSPVQINTEAFISVFDGGSFSNLPQPNGGAMIDALQAIIMNQAQFKKFPTYNSAVFNFVIDADASSGKKAAIRWYELRQDADGQPWSIYQEGTYLAADEKHAWNASLIMDSEGNIGMGYSGMGGTNGQRVSSYYTGRKATDPLGTMTIAEELIAAGNANIPGTRYGDYSKIDIDPSDYKTMWFINEYMNNGRKDVVGVFKIAADHANDVGVISIDEPVSGPLSANEPVKIVVHNFGTDAQSNFPISLKVNGTTIATENFTSTLAPGASVDYTFTATANLGTEGATYVLEAATQLTTDADNTNNAATKSVTHLNQLDAGVTEIIEPNSGNNMGTESIKVKVQNFGTSPLTNLQVQYQVGSGAPVVETISATIAPNTSLDYTFTQTYNFSAVQSYTIVAKTNLTNDGDTTNDQVTKTITNSSCIELENTTQYPIGPNSNTITESVITASQNFALTDVNVLVNLTHTYTGDLILKLIGPDGTQVTLANSLGGNGDNYTNTQFDDDATNSITTGSAPFTGVFKPQESLTAFNGKQSLGNWTLQITDQANGDGGNLLNWEIDLCGSGTLGVTNTDLDNNNFKVYETNSKGTFKAVLTDADMKKNVDMYVYNMAGQLLLVKRMNQNGSSFETEFDMTRAVKGAYVIKLSNGSKHYSKKIIVK
jgi:subtilisin-like proprotein convertase family protein